MIFPDIPALARRIAESMTKLQLTARVAELETLAAPVLDEDYCDIVVSAVRYALPRHSYMPSLTRDYLWKHWPHLSKKHWCILREDTNWPHGERHAHTPLTPIPET